MKKYMYFALALPLLFACSSDDLLDKEVVSNDQFAGIEKVDATFSLDEGGKTRMDNGTGWTLAEGDKYGFAWLGGGEATALTIDGKAWQNHPLTQTDGIFKPATSIYVGNYFLYRPYDYETVNIGAINFKSLEEQTVGDGMASSGEPWKALAETAIIIGDKWTNVTAAGTTDASGKIWEKAGIGEHYNIYAATFSNQTGLDLTYENNNVEAPAAGMHIAGATDIDYTIAAGTKIGAADIYEATVELQGAAKSFTYAPTTEPNIAAHSGTFWADKKNLDATGGFTFTAGAVTLKAPEDAENGISTDKADNKGWFWFNSLPVTNGEGSATSTVDVVLNTSYGTVTVMKDYTAGTKYTVADCAYALNVEGGVAVWHPLAGDEDLSKTPTVWDVAGTTAGKETFINQYGNHKGKFALNVDFSKAVMDGMHIKNDAHLQKLLKYYIAAGKNEKVALNLDADEDGNFKISKISIALIQTIQAAGNNVKVRVCTTHGTPKIIVTQDGQAAIGLADKKEVPSLVKVFKNATNVYLSSDCEWTWGGGTDGKTALKIDDQVSSITNEGTLTVNATNVQLNRTAATLANAAGATMNITQVTTVKNALTNLGTINVGSESNTTAELRAYAVEIKNDATALDAHGVINNFGVVGVTEGTTPAGKFNNYGLIDMKNSEAITLLTSNEIGTDPFAWSFVAGSQMMGTVILPEGNPTALVSVNNTAENGFIKYTWTGKTYATPEGNVKYNTIVVSDDITFDAAAPEVQYIEFNGTRTQVVNPETTAEPKGKLDNLKGVIVNENKSIIIEKGNILWPAHCGYLAPGATIYLGGKFTNGNGNTTVYLGTWSTDQIVKY